MGCIADVRAGKAVAMFLEEFTISYVLRSNADLAQSMLSVQVCLLLNISVYI